MDSVLRPKDSSAVPRHSKYMLRANFDPADVLMKRLTGYLRRFNVPILFTCSSLSLSAKLQRYVCSQSPMCQLQSGNSFMSVTSAHWLRSEGGFRVSSNSLPAASSVASRRQISLSSFSLVAAQYAALATFLRSHAVAMRTSVGELISLPRGEGRVTKERNQVDSRL